MSDSASPDEIPEENVRPKRFRSHWIAIMVLVLAHAALGTCFNPLGTIDDISDASIVFMKYGAIVSQPILLAFWASLAPQRFYNRFLWALLLCILISFAEEIGRMQISIRHEGLGLWMLVDAILFFAATLVLSIFRSFSRWRIVQRDHEEVRAVYQPGHFGIKHLLILTTITALGCGLFRTLQNMAPGMHEVGSIVEFISSMCIFLALLFPVVAIPWFTLANSRRLLFRFVIVICLMGIFDVAAYFLILGTSPRSASVHWYAEIVKPYLFIQIGASLSAIASTLVIRFCGYRMIRKAKAA